MSVHEDTTTSSTRILRSSNKMKKKDVDMIDCIYGSDFTEELMELDLPIFPKPIENGDISSVDFLTAAGQVIDMLNSFGKLFMPVRQDMQNNINKLYKKIDLDRKNHDTLQKLLIAEKNKNETVAIDALMWLKRALHMIQLFFENIVIDFKSGKTNEDLVATLKKSYEFTLEPYHGYMVKQLFSILSRMLPKRSQIFRALTDNREIDEKIVINDIAVFCRALEKNIKIIRNFYQEHKLENNYKVQTTKFFTS